MPRILFCAITPPQLKTSSSGWAKRAKKRSDGSLFSLSLGIAALVITLDIAIKIPIYWIPINIRYCMFNYCGLGTGDCQLAIGVGGLLLMPRGQEFYFAFRGETR